MDNTAGSLNDIYNFIYIAVIILGGVTLTLTPILNAKEKDKRNRAMLICVSSIFFYMITDFITYYFLGEMASGGLVFFFMMASDTLFGVLVAAWIYAVMVLARLETASNIKMLIIFSAIYLLVSQGLSIALGRYDSYTLLVMSGPWKTVLQAVIFVYDATVVIIGVRLSILIHKRYTEQSKINLPLIMSLLLAGYMIWIIYWDYSTWYQTEENLLGVYALDPLIPLYAALNIFMIHYFYKTDPLRISEAQISSEDAVNILARRAMLSDREKEVLTLVNKGLGNKQIAAELSISENTVKRHMSNIFKKTETQSRHELLYKISTANQYNKQI